VEIAECRPISKTKSWRLVRIVEAAATRTTLHETAAPLDEEPAQTDAQTDQAE